jgi:hypothetical protein
MIFLYFYLTHKTMFFTQCLQNIFDHGKLPINPINHEFITQKRKYDSITPVLISLHWLPVHYRCQYKLLIYVYKAQHGKAPSYLQELITPYKPNIALRSENSMLLYPPNDVRTKSYGERRFDKTAPTLWNSLPLSLRNVNSLDIFKRELKTHFFRIAFKNFL